jgi:hypothetical protein
MDSSATDDDEAGAPRFTIRPAEVGAPARPRLLLGAAVTAIVLFALLVAALLVGTAGAPGNVQPARTAPATAPGATR